ncbi:hypothetical protein [Sodalis sp. dw_96]|uniref:hypothetical protein n=1 Tax=Sodalis sp. dw_96 TaxID=2719794 RepID=UPI001BD60CCB|nr:hypothetical protein [Sodalis sp. dw_96]
MQFLRHRYACLHAACLLATTPYRLNVISSQKFILGKSIVVYCGQECGKGYTGYSIGYYDMPQKRDLFNTPSMQRGTNFCLEGKTGVRVIAGEIEIF